MNSRYITTPIFYVNDVPHIGHAYSLIAADVLTIYSRMQGYNVFMTTGVDEHGQKVANAAKAAGRDVQAYVNNMGARFESVLYGLDIIPNRFIRTTNKNHHALVRAYINQLKLKGLIEKRSYSGYYCTPCERFWTEKDLINGACPDCKRETELVEEENYFFMMSKYQDVVTQHIEDNPDYIMPESRRNEVLSFLRLQPLGDLCISRPVSRISWGIPFPDDPDYIVYIWFEALLSYRTLRGSHWPPYCQFIGKDILMQHAVYWTAICKALDFEPPKHIFAHGWWTVEGKKMSKSLGNAIHPDDIIEKYGNDVLRYYMLKAVPFGNDGNFSETELVKIYNADLANNLGNLVSRVLEMAHKYFDGEIGSEWYLYDYRTVIDVILGYNKSIERLEYSATLEIVFELIDDANKSINDSAPWKIYKTNKSACQHLLQIYSGLLTVIATLLYPFMPQSMGKLYNALGFEGTPLMVNLFIWPLHSGKKLAKIEQLFPRIKGE